MGKRNKASLLFHNPFTVLLVSPGRNNECSDKNRFSLNAHSTAMVRKDTSYHGLMLTVPNHAITI